MKVEKIAEKKRRRLQEIRQWVKQDSTIAGLDFYVRDLVYGVDELADLGAANRRARNQLYGPEDARTVPSSD